MVRKLHSCALFFILGFIQSSCIHSPILNVTRVFWITIHPDRMPDINLWPGILAEKYLGMRGDDSLLQYLTPRAKHSIFHRRCDGKDIPSTNAAALYMNHLNLWRRIHPGEVVAIFEEDAVITPETPRILERLERTRLKKGRHSLFHDDRFYLSFYAQGSQEFHCATTLSKPQDFDYEDELIEDASCSIGYGTSSYLVGYSVAQELLRNALPIDLQIDAYIALEAMFMYKRRPDLRFAKTKTTLYTQNTNLLNHLLQGSEVQRVDLIDFYKDPTFTVVFVVFVAVQCFVVGVMCDRCFLLRFGRFSK
jgi:GR25 family glycosyltransferase involved in LPS biosynthesis